MTDVPSPLLLALRGGKPAGRHEIPLDSEVIAGRTNQCDLVINHASVSRMHARIYHDATGVWVEDLGSANGTFLDDERVLRVTRLSDGQILRLGQKTLAQPILLRFQDPAAQLLKEMGLLSDDPPAPSESRATEPVDDPAAHPTVSSSEPEPEPPSEEPVTGLEEALEDPEEEEVPAEPVARPAWRHPAVLLAGFAALIIFLGFVFWISRFLRPSSTLWSTVQLTPTEVGPGIELTLQSPDIYPAEDLEVLLAGQAAENVKTQPGRMNLVIPTLEGREAGRSDLPLVVRNGDLELFQATLAYVVRPRVTKLDPAETVVGAELALDGIGFSDRPTDIEVWIGEHPASVVGSSRNRVRVIVPIVTRDRDRRLPVRVRLGSFESTAEDMLLVRPRPPEPIDFTLEPRWDSARSSWRVLHPFGTAFFLARSRPSGDEIPTAITDFLAAFSTLFTEAANDPNLGIEIKASGGRYQLRTTGEARSRTIAEWTPADLEATAAGARTDVTADMMSYWMAGVWNDFLTVFSQGERIPESPSSAPHVIALNRLVGLNLEAGGDGRPEMHDFDLLPETDRQALEQAFLAVPASFGSITGRWYAKLTDIFFEDDDYEIHLILDVKQRGRRLAGSAEITLKGPSVELTLPKASVSGSVSPGVPPEIRLEGTFNRPVGKLRLEGEASGSGLSGSYTSSMAAPTGQWSATRLR